ncbi:Carbohydrate binding domain-containing protein [Evansella caseinilytica]|uniref:Carbohydrate binding domain-containing protein n=1 Tax=Evansella caseinilytica TaxID=1503961 RepID=A0A1H3GMR3_9BACI|nr:family 16 glycosylhydrolase [Evansella caseinilytica]SDY04397.1 Carbohydrate binding domain-containing protein [Evansella caseinilytica]
MREKWIYLLLTIVVIIPIFSTGTKANNEAADATENLVFNGDFAGGTAGWETWNGEGGSSSFTVDNGTAEMNVTSIAGIHPEWGVPISWSTQLFQSGIQLEGGKTYQLSFRARATTERPIEVEYNGILGNLKQPFLITTEAATYTHEFTVFQDAPLKLIFLLGNVISGDAVTPNTPHSVFFDEVVIREIEEEDPETDREWRLVWSDEFDGTELDRTKWQYDTGNGFYSDGEWVPGWGNQELQYYSENNVRVEDGKLMIEAREETTTDEHGTYAYTSGKITTDGLFSQAYGKFEARIKLPAGQGYWPAFWMMPQDDVYGGWAASGEIDIMENRGSEQNSVGAAIHYGGPWPRNIHAGGTYVFPAGQSTTDFQVYSLEWEPGEIRWYVNGNLYTKITDWYSENGEYPAPFDQPFYLILNLAVGGWYGGNPDDTTIFPGQMVVDYVRVYEESQENGNR